jgi:hypothetical protein
MAYFDKTVKIQSPRNIVWKKAYEQTGAGRIMLEEPDRLLVAISQNVGYVYWLEEDTDSSTILRYLIDSAPSIQDAFRDLRDIPTALETLAARNEPPSLISVVGLLNLLGGGRWIVEIGEETIKQIKNKAEQTHTV